MSDYTPTTKTVLAYIRGNAVLAGATANEAQEAAVGWLAEVERAEAEKALESFAEHLLTSTMPEYGPGINVTPYRDGLIDGVNRAVIAASRFYRSGED